MKTKLYCLIIVFFFGNLFFSCQNDDPEDKFPWGECPSVLAYFKIIGILSQNLELKNNEYDKLENINENSIIPWNKFHLRYNFETEYIAKRKTISTTGSLMALSCVGPGYNGNKTGIDTLYIVTTNDYNEKYSAKDTINEIIKISNWDYYLDQKPEKLKSISNYIITNKERILSETFDIKLIEAPSYDGKHSFEIIYKLNNGEVFKHQSVPVELKK